MKPLLVPELLKLTSGLRVLDACAAPGGKTCHILESEDSLTACVALDRSPARLTKIEDNLNRLQLKSSLICADGADIGSLVGRRRVRPRLARCALQCKWRDQAASGYQAIADPCTGKKLILEQRQVTPQPLGLLEAGGPAAVHHLLGAATGKSGADKPIFGRTGGC